MVNDSFSLKSEQANIIVKGGFLNQIGKPEKGNSLRITPNGIELIMNENTSLESVEKEITVWIKKHSWLSYLWIQFGNKIGTILTLAASLAAIFLIALLSIHGSLTYELFSGEDGANILNFNGIYLYLLLSIFILLFLVFSPRIILGNYDNLFDWANNQFSTNARIVRRLQLKLKILLQLRPQTNAINLWNPMIAGSDSWISDQLIPAFTELAIEANLFIKLDEKEDMLAVLRTNNIEKFIHHSVPEADTNGLVYPYHLLSKWEKECFQCLLFSSTINLPESWIEKNKMQEIIISKELSERVYHLYQSKLSPGKVAVTFEKFINRCIFDYGYLSASNDHMVENLILKDNDLAKFKSATLLDGMADTVKHNMGAISGNLPDPRALAILLGLTESHNALNSRKIDLIQRFISNVKRTENYWLMNNYWQHISAEKEENEGYIKLGLMQFMNVQTLNELAACFVNSGMYTNAMEVFGILENISPAKIAIEIADLKDSLGEYKEALQILLKTDKEWVQSGKVEDMALILELYLNIAWVIVSGRFEDQREQGYEYLSKTDDILRKLPNAENYLLFLTRYFNTIANYHEWEQRYELAIKNYEKALMLPGTVLRKSSLLSNRGIAERLLGKYTKDEDAKKQHLHNSRSNIRQALEMKKNIGEKNQIPGSSHNLSETLIELAAITNDQSEKTIILKEADEVTNYALSILNELGSQKRRGRLLTERYIAHYMLHELGEISEVDLIKPQLKDWLGDEDKTSYDYREATRLLKQFGIDL